MCCVIGHDGKRCKHMGYRFWWYFNFGRSIGANLRYRLAQEEKFALKEYTEVQVSYIGKGCLWV